MSHDWIQQHNMQVYTFTCVWPYVFGIAYPLASPATLGFSLLPSCLPPVDFLSLFFRFRSLPPLLSTLYGYIWPCSGLPTFKLPVTLGFPPIDFPSPFSRVLAPSPPTLYGPGYRTLSSSCHHGIPSSRSLVFLLVWLPTPFTAGFPPPYLPLSPGMWLWTGFRILQVPATLEFPIPALSSPSYLRLPPFSFRHWNGTLALQYLQFNGIFSAVVLPLKVVLSAEDENLNFFSHLQEPLCSEGYSVLERGYKIVRFDRRNVYVWSENFKNGHESDHPHLI